MPTENPPASGLGPNIYLGKPGDLSLSFYPREPNGSFPLTFLEFSERNLKLWNNSPHPPQTQPSLDLASTVPPAPGRGRERRGLAGWEGRGCHKHLSPGKPPHFPITPSPTHPHAREGRPGPGPPASPNPHRPVPPAPASCRCPMAEGQGKLSKPWQPRRVPALFPVPEPDPGGL